MYTPGVWVRWDDRECVAINQDSLWYDTLGSLSTLTASGPIRIPEAGNALYVEQVSCRRRKPCRRFRAEVLPLVGLLGKASMDKGAVKRPATARSLVSRASVPGVSVIDHDGADVAEREPFFRMGGLRIGEMIGWLARKPVTPRHDAGRAGVGTKGIQHPDRVHDTAGFVSLPRPPVGMEPLLSLTGKRISRIQRMKFERTAEKGVDRRQDPGMLPYGVKHGPLVHEIRKAAGPWLLMDLEPRLIPLLDPEFLHSFHQGIPECHVKHLGPDNVPVFLKTPPVFLRDHVIGNAERS